MRRLNTTQTVAILGCVGFIIGMTSCAEEGTGEAEGSSVLDCGEHGFAHAGHCHCDDGTLFDGETCVPPEAITTVCETRDATEDEAHHHEACVCPADGICPCDSDIETLAGRDYCIPILSDETT